MSRTGRLSARHAPAVGVAVALWLFTVAAMRYPGGTTDHPGSVGYSVARNFISTLFQPRALNGADNPARYVADVAMLALCASLGVMFWRIARTVSARAQSKTIEIGGLGAMVYTFLVVTPMHDLMVTLGLAFSLPALIGIIYASYAERRLASAVAGASCVALVAGSAVMYYGHLAYGALPAAQKITLVACVAWVVSVYYARTAAPDGAAVRRPAAPRSGSHLI